MDDGQWKVQLGVELDTKDLNTKISKLKPDEPIPIKVQLDTKEAEKQISNLKEQIQEISKIKINLGTGTGGKGGSGALREVKQEMTDFIKLQNKIGNMEIKIGKLKIAGGHSNQIAVLEDQLKSLKNTYDDLMQTFMKKITTNVDLQNVDVSKFSNDYNAAVQKVENALNELEAQYADTQAKLAKDIEIELDSAKFKQRVEDVRQSIERLDGSNDELKRSLQEINNALSSANSSVAENNVDGIRNSYEQLIVTLDKAEYQLEQLQKAQTLDIERANVSRDIDLMLENYSAAPKEAVAQARKLKQELQSCDKVRLGQIKKEVSGLKKDIQLTGKATRSFVDQIKDKFGKFASYFTVASAFMYVEQGLRDMFEQVVAIDSAMTELKKVTDETDATYDRFLENAAARAKELGTTIDGLVTSAADFARLGYGFSDVQGLAEAANIYAVVGDEIDSVETATKSLISTMTAFKDEMNGMSDTDFAMSIVDKFNEVSNNFAISSGGIGEALQRSASSLAAANNTVDESIALITAANTVVVLCHAA